MQQSAQPESSAASKSRDRRNGRARSPAVAKADGLGVPDREHKDTCLRATVAELVDRQIRFN